MFTKPNTYTRVGISVIAGVLLGFLLALVLVGDIEVDTVKDALTPSKPGAITSVYVAAPNIVIEAEALETVEVYADSAALREKVLVGTSTLVEASGRQRTWIVAIPDPMFIKEITVEAIDLSGDDVEEYVYPTRGIAEIYRELWESVPETVFSLNVNNVMRVGNDTFTLLHVLEDSRCPAVATCIHAGRVVTELLFTSETGAQESYIISNSEEEVRIGDHFVRIVSVEPEAQAGVSIPENDYVIGFSIITNQKNNE